MDLTPNLISHLDIPIPSSAQYEEMERLIKTLTLVIPPEICEGINIAIPLYLNIQVHKDHMQGYALYQEYKDYLLLALLFNKLKSHSDLEIHYQQALKEYEYIKRLQEEESKTQVSDPKEPSSTAIQGPWGNPK